MLVKVHTSAPDSHGLGYIVLSLIQARQASERRGYLRMLRAQYLLLDG